jgi:hypothetical protein
VGLFFNITPQLISLFWTVYGSSIQVQDSVTAYVMWVALENELK